VADGSKGSEAGDGQGDSRRDEILRSAVDVMAERGFVDTRIADVAERAGTSPALVIYYFRTKDKLLTEAVRLAEDLWLIHGFERLAAVSGAVARLESLITANFTPAKAVGSPDVGALWIDLWARSLRHPEVAGVRREFDARWRRVIADVVREGQATGDIADRDADEFAIAFTALLDGLSVQLVLGDPALDPATAVRISMRFAADWLGFAWSPAESLRT
jgi:AcrR family transcriptional regulator